MNIILVLSIAFWIRHGESTNVNSQIRYFSPLDADPS